MIADYSFYSGEYYGKLLSEEEFPEYATRADAYLDQMTTGRYASPDLPEKILLAVKFAECAVSELCQQMAADSACVAILATHDPEEQERTILL